MSSDWKGMNNISGKTIEGDEHLKQSIADILLTPLGSRVMRRDYGSALFSLIDQGDNEITRLRLMSAAVTALWKWEPRITPSSVTLTRNGQGALTLKIKAQRSDSLNSLSADVTLTGGS